MRRIIPSLLQLFPARERRHIKLMVPAIIGMALLQVAGIGSIMPFLAVVADPKVVTQHELLRKFFDWSGANDMRSFLIFLGTGSFLVLLISNAVTAAVTWWMVRFTEMRTHFLATLILERHLQRPYIDFLERHSADLGVRVLGDVVQIVTGMLLPALQLLAQSAMSVILLAFLFAVDPTLSFVVFVGLGGLYVVVYLLVRGRLLRIGVQKADANAAQFRALSEASGAIKEIKLHHLEEVFLRRFKQPNLIMARTVARQSVLSTIPSYAMETIAFGGIVAVVVYLLASGRNVVQVLPLLGIYGYSILRIKPALQGIYASITQIRFNQPILERVQRELQELDLKAVDQSAEAAPSDLGTLDLRASIELDRISFKYPSADRALFDSVSLSIKANSSVAFVGPTGSGKSTLVDIILGLLEPQGGGLHVDGVRITAINRREWQTRVSYVPQHIYLADVSIGRNIAFGLDDAEIDWARVENAARIANIHDFIAQLPQGYETEVGERGARLSGGQRQRIGIARALYRDASVLVLDEATSALDGITEQSVFESVREFSKTRTVIIVAHRIGTVRNCEEILLLDHGRIMGSGTYDELMVTSPQFRAMSNTGVGNATAHRL
jgi:ABC-type multidrug transport system fused ATPase/permease subunit